VVRQGAFEELAKRLEAVGLDGPVEKMRSRFLGGRKRMPIRYRMRPARKVRPLPLTSSGHAA
jgi:hypothetical protein